jgi:UDP-GlcNAc:undecaprenyl-phosphate GlcNAc-1-phosphate transferase
LVASFAAALAGMSLGFLRHNFPPARIFLGDAGSLTLGFLLAALGLKLDLPVADVWVRVTVAFLILGVPVFDTALVVVSRRRAGRPVMVGGTDHTSHRLAGLGLSSREVALGIYALQFACCTVAVAMINAPSAAPVILLVEIAIAISALVALIASAKRRGPADPGTPAPSA